jgi:hypothetical protein
VASYRKVKYRSTDITKIGMRRGQLLPKSSKEVSGHIIDAFKS